LLDKDVRNALFKLGRRETAAFITVMKHSVNHRIFLVCQAFGLLVKAVIGLCIFDLL
jgi:hypothetical protein